VTTDTIVAISTPPGRGGIGIVRLSGPDAKSIAEPILKLHKPLIHAAARFAEIFHEGTRLDEAIVTYFAAPHSYTAEDVVEIAAHGSPIVLDHLVRHALAQGARLARPGEFTERAFLSGRLDLTQAEAVRDLIEANTLVQARLAAAQMGGALSRRIAPVKELLISLIAILEAGIDFAEDDIDVLPSAAISEKIHAIAEALVPIAASYTAGRLIHDGLTLAIVGPPNAGKSSLFNRLIERDRAIVTPVPGTTRDLVTERISLAGIPIELIDTAGLRETIDPAEQIGIGKTRESIADADVVLAVVDATIIVTKDDEPNPEPLLPTECDPARTILVANKIDLLPPTLLIQSEQILRNHLGGQSAEETYSPSQNEPHSQSAIQRSIALVSALTGAGIPALRQQILSFLQAASPGTESGMLTTIRHYEAITQCQAALAAAELTTEQNIPHEMLLLDLYNALQSLDTLTGATTPDDILNRIFSSFCIGK
jgi:tRNA modification GTPase